MDAEEPLGQLDRFRHGLRLQDRVAADHLLGLGERPSKDNGAPGVRTDYGPSCFAAFLIDLDGNNVEAVCMRQTRVAPQAYWFLKAVFENGCCGPATSVLPLRCAVASCLLSFVPGVA